MEGPSGVRNASRAAGLLGKCRSSNGGAIINHGSLNLTTVTVKNNTAFTNGGGLYVSGGTATVSNATFSSNTAFGGDGYCVKVWTFRGYRTYCVPPSNGLGGAISVTGGTVTVTSTSFSSNTATVHQLPLYYSLNGLANAYGGAVYVGGGTVTLRNDIVTGNSALQGAGATGEGGGLSIATAASVSLDAFTQANVINNTASTAYPNIDGSYTICASLPSYLGVGAPAKVSAGTAFSVTVRALDLLNEPTPGYTGTIHFTSSDPLAVLPANYTFTTADQGVHTFSVTLKTAGSQTVTVTDPANATLTGQAAAVTEFTIPTANSVPGWIVAGPDGNLWFTEFNANTIARLTPPGVVTEFTVPTSASQPDRIISGSDGNLWFTEYGAGKIGRITPAGVFTEFPVPYANSKPYTITAGPDGNLWFTDQAANLIGRLTWAGQFAGFSAGLPANSGLQGITPGPDGNLWFEASISNIIGRITPTGAISVFPIPTANSGPLDITWGPDNNLWFSEYTANQIGRITPAGAFSEFALSTGGGPDVITRGPDGDLWFTEYRGNRIGRMTTSGVLVGEVTIPTPNSGSVPITTGPDGAIWFAEMTGNKIGRLQLGINVVASGAAGNASNGLGPGVSNDGSTPFGFGSLSSTGSTITHNRATGGEGDDGGSAGQGIGGGLYLADGGIVCLGTTTVVKKKRASTSDPDIFGSYTLCP